MQSTSAVLETIRRERDAMLALLVELVRMPSLGGSPHEVGIQQRLVELFQAFGLETDVWDLPLDSLTAEPDFPGSEVERTQALGVIGRLPGGRGRTLMFNAHVDVVPPGDLAAWTAGNPFSGVIAEGKLIGRPNDCSCAAQ